MKRAIKGANNICLNLCKSMSTAKSSMNRLALGVSLGILFGFSCAYMWFKIGTYDVLHGPVSDARYLK